MWHFTGRSTTESDEQGRILTQFGEVYDEDTESWQPESRLYSFPRGTSGTLLDSFYVEVWVEENSEWQRALNTRNYYDDQDRLERTVVFMAIMDEQYTFEDEYIYDENGDNTELYSYLGTGDERLQVGLQTMQYQNHRLTTSTTSLSDGIGNIIPQERSTYTYTGAGQQDTVRSYLWSPVDNEWILGSVENYDYNGMGSLTDVYTTTYDASGTTTNTWTKNTYISGTMYLESEEEFTFVDSLNNYFRESYTRYFYQDASVAVPDGPGSIRVLAVWPNPTTTSVTIELNESALLRLYDQYGRLLQTRAWSPGQDRFDLSGLPAGIYQFGAETTGGRYTARLVKH